jgi:hypothetical protein
MDKFIFQGKGARQRELKEVCASRKINDFSNS